MSYTLSPGKNNMGSYNYGIRSSYLKSKVGGIITDFESKFLIVGISAVNCSLLQVFSENEVSAPAADPDRFYKILLNDGLNSDTFCIDCSSIINRNLENIVFWLNAYPSSLISHISLDNFDEIVSILKQSSSIPYRIKKAM